MPDTPDVAAAPAYRAPALPFPVVGIGASAGGLPALLRLFENMPATTGMAFVIVLHLSPRHSSTADHVLQRVTRMPVRQVTGTVPIEPNHVYVIAPNMELCMMDGALTVREMERRRGQHVAIDRFFRTLADAQSERAVAIVLSGTGADGAVGIGRVKEKGGVILAQSPLDAEHDGMPQAAMDTGRVDFVMAAVEMPQKLIEIWANARTMEMPAPGPGEPPVALTVPAHEGAAAEEALERVIGLLRVHTGHDFRNYKRATVLRRIERRMQVRAVHSLPEYQALLESDPGEPPALLNDLLIGVTNFFRDREAFEAVERDIMPFIFRDRKASDQVRAWVAACATGEEAYSLAMLMANQAALMEHPPQYQVFASDIDEQSLALARIGLYPSSIVTDVAPSRLREFFTRDDGRYHIRKSLRDRILFASHNLLRDPPFSQIDLISCRNLLIYLNRDVQMRVLELFHFALKPGGFLFLGGSESADAAEDLFVAVDKKNRIYRARTAVRILPNRPAPGGFLSERRTEPRMHKVAVRHIWSPAEVHQRALVRFAPPSVLIDSEHNIVHSSEGAGRFLRVAAGEPSRDIYTLVLPDLRLDLRSALYQCQQSGAMAERRRVRMTRDGNPILIDIEVHPFRDGDAETDFMLVTFWESEPNEAELAGPHRGSDEAVVAHLETELQRKRQQLQETIEHAEISNEELRAANEELQAINEELRSATEELEASKEELQSMNEELITVNYELKLKVEETGKANDDLNNLIASTDIATIFVDSGMRIKRFTPRAADIFSIIPSDINRSLLDLTHRLDYDALADDVARTFQTLRMVERELRSNDGRYYIVRLLPYRTTEDRIEGAVLTFFDISSRREAEEKLRQGEARMQLVAESTRDYAIITLDGDGRINSWNLGAERMFGYTEAEVLGQSLDFLYLPEERNAGVAAEELRRAVSDGRAAGERWHLRKDGTRVYADGVTAPLHSQGGEGFVKIARDESDRVREDQQRADALSTEQRGRSNAETASALKDEFLAIRGAVVSQAKIIDDLLDMSRMRTGKLALSMAPLDLAPVAQLAVDSLRADAAAAGLSIGIEGEGTALPVLADAVRIEQVVMNLLSNAIKFTPSGGAITVRMSRVGAEARIDVSDSGQGIAASFLPHVFEMFSQPGSVTTRAKGGLGIGLALVREIMALHGGRVEAASIGPNKGACFSIWLPLLAEGPVGNLAAPAAQHDIAGVRVLLVDDVEDAVTVCQLLLEMQGAKVITATSARAALELMQRQQVDVLVSDISMPEMDGYELLQAAHALPQYAHLPAVAVSGLAREQDIAAARSAGFSAHIGKPMSVDRLVEIISDLLRRDAK
jgi:two-component system CheB/CheR fusion protein